MIIQFPDQKHHKKHMFWIVHKVLDLHIVTIIRVLHMPFHYCMVIENGLDSQVAREAVSEEMVSG